MLLRTQHVSSLRRFDATRVWESTITTLRYRSLHSSNSEVQAAKAYCKDLLRKYDTPSHTLQAFIPRSSQTAYLAIRAFNVEIARIADTVSTPQVGALRLEFWRSNLRSALDGQPRQQPVCILLAHAADELATRTNGKAALSKSWFLRIIAAREQYLTNAPYTSLDAVERYAEHTYSTLLYLTLQSLPLNSLAADHVASHLGKAAGIVAVLRGLPLLAFPPPPNHHSSNAGIGSQVQDQRTRSRQGYVPLPLDVMAKAGLREEDVLRRGAEAPGLRDAVFEVATRASDHLITARAMMQNLRSGDDVGHAFEHGEEAEHVYPLEHATVTPAAQVSELHQAFGVFMPAISTGIWLDRLQKLDFDLFRHQLRMREWTLPWRAYLAYRRKAF